MQGLQASFSRPLRVRSAGVAEAMPVSRSNAARPALVVDSERPITTTAFADVGFALGSDNEVAPRERDEALSRGLNVIIAAVALVVVAPLIGLIAIAIKLTSRGPVLYSQTRVGVDRRWRYARKSDRRLYDHGGRLFTMYKFRTMQVNAEPDGRAVWASKSDPRVTLIGRFLRGTRLDEVPQLWNVLRGDMNIVGPRPERPTIVAELRRHIPEYQQRHRVKPGITGWAQVNQSYDACIDDVRQKVQLDLEYVRRQGVMEDLRIMSMTVPVILFRKGGW
jgi:lipopolysaccharide/colanic/teichoic acid biosynthesis glycosyltransferase